MRGLNIHKNIPVSVTKLMFVLQVCFISSRLTADKLFPVNSRVITSKPKMSPLLEATCTSALIIKSRLMLVAHTDDLGRGKTSNLQLLIFVQNINRIVSKPNVTPGHILYCTANCIPIDLRFKENFLTNTQVWNSLSHRNDCLKRGVIRVTYGCYKSSPYQVINITHQEVKCYTTCMDWTNNRIIATRHCCGVKGCNTMFICGAGSNNS